jgi:hypothetical protein
MIEIKVMCVMHANKVKLINFLILGLQTLQVDHLMIYSDVCVGEGGSINFIWTAKLLCELYR